MVIIAMVVVVGAGQTGSIGGTSSAGTERQETQAEAAAEGRWQSLASPPPQRERGKRRETLSVCASVRVCACVCVRAPTCPLRPSVCC